MGEAFSLAAMGDMTCVFPRLARRPVTWLHKASVLETKEEPPEEMDSFLKSWRGRPTAFLKPYL